MTHQSPNPFDGYGSSMIASEPEQKEFKKLDAGVYPARCYSIVDLGTHEEDFEGEKKIKSQIRIGWEFPTELAVFKEELGEQPFALYKTYTLSLSEKSKLRADLEAWRGKAFTAEELKGFDLKNILGKTCQILVVHMQSKKNPDKIVVKIQSLMALSKGMVVPPSINPEEYITKPDWIEYVNRPNASKFVVEDIKKSREWIEMEETYGPII